jgi:hypothetical protein
LLITKERGPSAAQSACMRSRAYSSSALAQRRTLLA